MKRRFRDQCVEFEKTRKIAESEKVYKLAELSNHLPATKGLVPALVKPTSQTQKAFAAQKTQLKKTTRALKAAKRSFEDQVNQEAKQHCLSIFSAMYVKLPRELRDIILDHLISSTNATFYKGKDGKVHVANGCSDLQHVFDASFTGSGVHRDAIEALVRKGARFDFRRRHDLIAQAFAQYDFPLALTLTKVGFNLNAYDIKTREKGRAGLDALFQLQKGSSIHVFVEADGKTQEQVGRSFRQITRAFMAVFSALKDAGYVVNIVMNASYLRSNVTNDVDSRFSIIQEQDFRYNFSLAELNAKSPEVEKKLREACRLSWMNPYRGLTSADLRNFG
ncbi:hypothetical protein FB567DRAFT_479808 [Paraphoma chrysanthemicola]|uniref:Uncharacterized protein n=1 Tax=Paraphoma chrysanthemicola TaxID=798071 RepID=A0A8K0VTL5_9PLEO|nr:hypothetical protein FB567DRAFT_479808 [Paraphoma chrysanthemicola]